jgi:hypothetical protein
MKKLIISLLVFGLAGTANALNLSFSTDGSTPLPDGASIYIAVGSTTTLYLMSDTGGDTANYWTYIDMALPQDAYLPAAGDYTIYPAAGTLASVRDYSTASLYDMELTAADGAVGDGYPLAGVHFAFDLVTGLGIEEPFYFWNTVPNDGEYPEDKRVYVLFWNTVSNDGEYPEDKRVYVLPEPGTIALLGLGGVLLRRRRKTEKA